MSSKQKRDRSSIAVRLGVAAAMLMAGAAAQADDAAHRPMLTGYTDTVGGESIVSGDYHAMIAEVTRFKDTGKLSPTVYNTNLCVGYIVTRQMDEARAACNAAVRAAKRERTQEASWMVSSRKELNKQVAIAYSNRAVMHWVAHNTAAAASDLAKAEALTPDAAYVARNTQVFSTRSAVAQTEKAPRS